MLVTAGPGSGKTYVIVARLIHMLLEYHIPPEKILVITFTKEAAESMQKRFKAAYDDIASQSPLLSAEIPISFGTFHSFYYQIIRSIPKYSRFRLINEKEKKYILSCLYKEDAEDKLLEKLAAVSFFKNTGDRILAAARLDMDPVAFSTMLEKYDLEKDRRQVLDFDDMLFLCLKLLSEDSSLLKKWRQKFSYYLVDEFQDCNPIQYKLLKLLANENLFVVGDDDQAIYGFRGADAMILQEFLKDFPDAVTVNMGINYRCSREIVKASSIMISENKMRLQKKLEAKEKLPGEKVVLKKWSNREEMYVSLVRHLKEKCEEQRNNSAVLLRTNQEAQMLAMSMLRENIPYRLKDKSISIYEHFVVKDMMTFLKAANGDRSRKIFLRILNKPRTNIGREALESEIVDFDHLKEFYNNPYMYNAAALKDIEKLENHLKRLSRMKIVIQIRYIRMAMQYEAYLQKRAGENSALFSSWLEILEWLEEESLKYKSLEEWLGFQKEYEMKMQRTPKEDIKNGVYIMTIHASKGLEFDHCYILNVNEGTIPQYKRGQKLTDMQMEEERRIFYVGMTRAKKTLELHYLTGTKERPKFPSRFIHRIENK